jgi:hypothetical protein
MSDTKDLMQYEHMAQEALRGVIKQALKKAASPERLPGDHHLYITFQTRAPGVSVPNDLSSRYRDEMTIVLQHQFWDLAPGETFFSVVLKFDGQPKKLSVPYAAVTRFQDPSVGFGLQFPPGPVEEPAGEVQSLPARAPKVAVVEVDEPPEPTDDGPKIVSLDNFRKK